MTLRSISRSAPTLGWNDRDPLALMEPGWAIRLENWLPETGGITLRNGRTDWITGGAQQFETLATYAAASGTEKLWGWAGTSLYDCSSQGALPSATLTGLTNARWQTTMMATSAGQFLMAFNGFDAPRNYDGSAWNTTPAITGPGSANNLIQATTFKQRLFMVEKNTASIWYLPVNSIGGAASQLNYASLLSLGGFIQAVATWTVDAGSGLDDLFVAVSSKGEVLIFSGIDPSLSTWELVGVYRLGAPIGRRPFLKLASDLIVITVDGFFPLSEAIVSDRVNPAIAISDPIRNAVSDAAELSSAKFGWQAIHYPTAHIALFNIPVNEGSLQEQYVMNTITRAWCKFSNWEINTFAIFQGNLYGGANGKVYKLWNGHQDGSGNIESRMKTAFDYFEERAIVKNMKMIRPIYIVSSGSITPLIGVNVDYEDSDPIGSAQSSQSGSALYGTAVFGVDKFGGGTVIDKHWRGAPGTGMAFALVQKTASSGIDLKLTAIDYLVDTGGVL